MIDSDRKSKAISKWAQDQKTQEVDAKRRKRIQLTDLQLAAWQLLSCGHTEEVVSHTLRVGRRTITRWKAKIKAELSDLPTIELGADRLMTLIPKALNVVDECLDGVGDKATRAVAYQAAKDVLTANHLFTERMAVQDDRVKRDEELIKEGQDLMLKAQGQIKGKMEEIGTLDQQPN